MKPPRLIFLLSLLLLTGVAMWMWCRDTVVPVTGRSHFQAPEPKAVRPQAMSESVTNLAVVELRRPAAVSARDWPLLLAFRQAKLAQNQPVNFFARVTDQNGNPISQARLALMFEYVDEEMFRGVDFVYRKMGDEIKHTNLVLLSDARGHLELTGKRGLSLYVEDLIRDGFLWDRSQSRPFNFTKQLFDPTADHANQNTGHLFSMWKKGQTEPLIRWSKRINISRDQPQHALSLFAPERSATNDADLIIETPLMNPQLTEAPRAYDRWIIFRPQNGGIAEGHDAYPYQAATEKYDAEWKFLYRLDTQESTGWKKIFYLQSRGSQVFASLVVRFFQSPMSLEIEAVVNPSHSRNLEPDPAKQITDPEEIRRLDEATRGK